MAAIFIGSILSQNTLIAEGFGGVKKTAPKIQVKQVKNNVLDFNQIADQVGNYIQDNIKTIAAANNAGDGGSTVDSVNIITSTGRSFFITRIPTNIWRKWFLATKTAR